MKIKFGTLELKDGKAVESNIHVMDTDDVESNNPIAFMYGKHTGMSGRPINEAPEDDELASEYVRGYEIGRKIYEATN